MQATIEQPQTKATTPTTPTRVLVIDDNEQFCEIVQQMLEPLGYKVSSVANPVKALEVYARDRHEIDLVILDYFMPTMDGAQTYDWLRKLNSKIRVILCSGADELRLRQLMAQNKIDAYIHKPFRLQEALYTIRQVMAKPAA